MASHAGGEACVCDISAGVDVSQPAVSHHLKDDIARRVKALLESLGVNPGE